MSMFFSRYYVSPTNKTDSLDMTKILLKVTLNTITLTFTIMSNKLILAGSELKNGNF